MMLLREQIDVLLDNMEAATWIRHRENPNDPTLARDLVAQTRALLRTVDLEHHVRICDHVQQLILGMECPDDPASTRLAERPAFLHIASARGWVPDLGIPLMDDPFDLDAYGSGDDDASAYSSGAGNRPDAEPAAEQRRERERRLGLEAEANLRTGLTAKQLATLDTMAVFGWKLEFVRRPMFRPPQPVAFDRNRQRFVVVDADGRAEEDATVRVRP